MNKVARQTDMSKLPEEQILRKLNLKQKKFNFNTNKIKLQQTERQRRHSNPS